MLGLCFHQIILEKSFRFFLEDVVDVVKYTFKRWLLIVYKTFSFANSLVDLLVPRNFIVIFIIIFRWIFTTKYVNLFVKISFIVVRRKLQKREKPNIGSIIIGKNFISHVSLKHYISSRKCIKMLFIFLMIEESLFDWIWLYASRLPLWEFNRKIFGMDSIKNIHWHGTPSRRFVEPVGSYTIGHTVSNAFISSITYT